MCGICGIVGFDDRTLLKRMCNVIYHRGPDDSGIFLDRNICMGAQSLFLTRKIRQPIRNEDGSLWLVCDGTIYNFQELVRYLESRGHEFYTNSDIEVIVHLYEEFGNFCVKKIRGTFAFGIWDGTKKKLFLARDRIGVKPLYYVIIGNNFLFASEIKSLLQYDEIKREIDTRALHYFLTFRYVPGPRTMFKGIKKLQPGHNLTYKKGKVKISKYWDLSYSPIKESEKYYIERLQELIKESIEIRLRNVPIAVYLSGGLDSSYVTGVISNLVDEPIKTFSVGFGVERFDELKYAKVIANHFNTDHHEFIIESDAARLLPEIIWRFDEPIADPAAIPTYFISKEAKNHAKIIFGAEGGDELFGGYEHWKIMLMSRKYLKFVPKEAIFWFANKLPKFLLDKFFMYSSVLGEEGMRRFSDYLLSMSNIGKSYLSIISIFDEKERNELCINKTGFKIAKNLNDNYFKNIDSNNLLNHLSLFEIKTQMPDDLAMKWDKMLMTFSLEPELPLLDHKLMEFSATIPSSFKIRGLTEKYIFRKLMSSFIPKEIVKRKKQRFFVPIDSWIEKDLWDIICQIFSEQNVRSRGYFKWNYISHIFQNFGKSKLYYSRQLWNLLTFELWHRIFIDSDNLRRPQSILKRALL
ncbi:MAG: asparagine synthase (glutamine-hydrolyzing) [Candidatus Aenigmarchaeota archaeon]|nr:asparagine synthase (glutamine-hydrolyzing) [Candidatus Aenigmarchaeota archaeon]